MGEKVEAWKDDAGVLHETQLSCAEADARASLLRIGVFHADDIAKIVDNWQSVHAALCPMAHALNADKPVFRARGEG